MKRHLQGLVLVAALVAAAPAWALEVVTTIKPVHSLVSAVMGKTDRPHLLIDGASSPHSFALSPSGARALQQADVVFWVGPRLETFLSDPLETLASDATSVALIDAPGLTLLELRSGGDFEGHTHDHEHDHHHEHGDADQHADHDDGHEHADHDDDHAHSDHEEHDHADHGDHHSDDAGVDQHIWLDPQNALAMLVLIADTLAEADPENQEIYRTNAAAAAQMISAAQSEIADALAPIESVPFIVFHDAYHYFEARFGIEATAAIALNPEAAPGARRMREIRAAIDDKGAVCVFREPQFDPRVIDAITENTGVTQGVLDPIGVDIAEGPEHYPALLRSMSDAFVRCLSR